MLFPEWVITVILLVFVVSIGAVFVYGMNSGRPHG